MMCRFFGVLCALIKGLQMPAMTVTYGYVFYVRFCLFVGYGIDHEV